jgi:hypothetical protein
MELIPKEIEAILPSLYSQENVPDPVAVIKLFDPVAATPCTFWKVAASLMAICSSSDSVSPRSGRTATRWDTSRSASLKMLEGRSDWASSAISTSNPCRSPRSHGRSRSGEVLTTAVASLDHPKTARI